jgi:TIR domain-containing protein
MARVFVSYAHQDREIVQQIAEGLRALQHQVFFAGDAVTAGKPWREIIAGSLQEADAVIIIISKESVRSNWIMAEVGAAIAYSRERGKSSVIPVVIDDINPPAAIKRANLQAYGFGLVQLGVLCFVGWHRVWDLEGYNCNFDINKLAYPRSLCGN